MHARRARPSPRAHRADRYTAANGNKTAPAPVSRRRANRHADRWCWTSIRYGVRDVLAPWTWVTAPRRFVRDLEAGAPQPPAEVEVLHVHEVALVPAADRVERAPPQPHRRARDPVDRTGLATGRRSSSRYRAVNGFVGHQRPSRPCATASGTVGDRRADG